MPSDYHDFVQLPTEGQVTPTVYTAPGVMTTVSQPNYIGQSFTSMLASAAGPNYIPPYQFGTQDNTEVNLYLSNYPWQTAVVGPIYNSPGGILNKAPGQQATTTGGGP